MNKNFILFLFILFSTNVVKAHQPIMDMAPRWQNGYGVQIRHESYNSGKLIDRDSAIINPQNKRISVNKTWLEGVYTFDKAIRVTFKIPYVRKSNFQIDSSQNITRQTSNGIGDLILGLPLKYYVNKGDFTSNLSFTPSIRFATGSSSRAIPISDESTDIGLSFAYNVETSKFYHLYDLFYWFNNQGKRGINDGNELGLDINIGLSLKNIKSYNALLLWDVSIRLQDVGRGLNNKITGGERIHTGPVIALYKDAIIFRVEYKISAYEVFKDIGIARGNEFSIGLGIVY